MDKTPQVYPRVVVSLTSIYRRRPAVVTPSALVLEASSFCHQAWQRKHLSPPTTRHTHTHRRSGSIYGSFDQDATSDVASNVQFSSETASNSFLPDTT